MSEDQDNEETLLFGSAGLCEPEGDPSEKEDLLMIMNVTSPPPGQLFWY